MHKLVVALSAIALLAGCASEEKTNADNVAEAKGIIKEFFGSLKGELETSMKAGGPTNAILTCKGRAPMIADEWSKKSGWDVGRTSLKLRNPANEPDAWERQVLVQFAARKDKGEDLATMDYSEVVNEGGHKTFRYMKAIPVQDLCLTCHGTKLKPDVVASLKKLYPTDRATGYKVGDLRGAFTLSKKL